MFIPVKFNENGCTKVLNKEEIPALYTETGSLRLLNTFYNMFD